MGRLPGQEEPWDRLLRARQAIVVVDLVESVRLLFLDEERVVRRWRAFVELVRREVLSDGRGRLVKHLGDGMLLAFATAELAAASTVTMHRLMAQESARHPGQPALTLRQAAHIGDVLVDDIDLYGHDVNLCARLAGLARPGETIVSASLRDALVDRIDGNFEDLGRHYLKHVDQPVRVWRMGSPEILPAGEAGGRPLMQRPAIAVIPLAALDGGATDGLTGDVLADALIQGLSTHRSITLLSRLSTSAFRGRGAQLAEVSQALGADYIVSGTCSRTAELIHFHLELADARSGAVLLSERRSTTIAALLAADSEAIVDTSGRIAAAVVRTEVARALRLPLSTLSGYTCLLAAETFMHRLSLEEFARSRELVEHLSEREPRRAAPRALLAKWHVLRTIQGWSPDERRDLEAARELATAAIEHEPHQALALSIDALVCAHADGDPAGALPRAMLAVQEQPNEPHAWLVLTGLHVYLGDGEQAQHCAERAIALSPLDPSRFLFDTFLAAARLAGGQYEDAIVCAQRAIHANARHPSSHRLLTIALAQSGQMKAARASADRWMALQPDFSLKAYAARSPGRSSAQFNDQLNALRAAGLT